MGYMYPNGHTMINSQLYSVPQANYSLSFSASSVTFDSSILIGDIINSESCAKNTIKPDKKFKERKSSFNSTCKSTSHSHQENVPHTNEATNEEMKQESEISDIPKMKDSLFRLQKTPKKSKKQCDIEYQRSKIREPLTVRKIDKNRDVLCDDLEFSRNLSNQFSTLPAKTSHLDFRS